jgi:phosphatidylinositol alpha-1,6-mannosyltransferase
MRLLFITQDFPPDVGGTQTYAYELARRLARRCADFAVLAPHRPGDAAVDATLPFDVVRIRASYDTLSIKALGPVLRLARQRRFDTAFHVQWPTAIATLLARPFGGPQRILVAAHGRELLLEPLAHIPLLNTLYNGLRNTVLRRVDGLFPVSHYTGTLLKARGVPPERIRVLNNGTDPARFYPMDATALRENLGLRDRKTLLTISRLVPRKGIDTVLRALPRILEAVPQAFYLIGGDGPDRERLASLAQHLGVTNHVRFLGRIPYDDLRRYYNVGDIFVMPSRQDEPYVEGFGLVFLEANACGKPVVGAHAGGIPDAVRDGETGLLVAPDDVAGLADALIRLLTDIDFAAMLGSNGRQRVLHEANWDRVADRLYHWLAAS